MRDYILKTCQVNLKRFGYEGMLGVEASDHLCRMEKFNHEMLKLAIKLAGNNNHSMQINKEEEIIR